MKLYERLTKILFCLIFVILSCRTENTEGNRNETYSSTTNASDRPNILWLVTEDMGAYIPSFGDSTIVTPNLSRLANEGIVFPNVFSPSGVCAPSRAAIATGMYPTSFGANHMRTNSYTEVTGLPAYEAVPPKEVKMISELLRVNGYYCSNNNKEDYQFIAPKTAWDESSPYAHWRNRAKDQPFFSVFNFNVTHESNLFEPYGFSNFETRHYHSGDTDYQWPAGRMTEEETPHHLAKNTEFSIPPYLPDSPIVKRDMWKLYNNIAEMDRQVGAILKQLEDDGLLENTIILFFGDHGGPLPREKRLIYDSGLNTPLIIRFPKKRHENTKNSQLISFVDFAPTLLSLIGVTPPDYMQGQDFLGDYKAKKERQYIYAAADRFDGFTDAIRAVRDKRFKYIRNYRPEQGYYLPVRYRENIPAMKELLRLKKDGKLTEEQSQWFRKSKPREELFDLDNDPNELINLADQPIYQNKLLELSKEMDSWLEQIGDDPNQSEKELIKELWDGNDEQPKTQKPSILIENGRLKIECSTPGASIAYKITNKNDWQVYTKPLAKGNHEQLEVQAHRIGYLPSEILKYR